jgi:hypothetical protein
MARDASVLRRTTQQAGGGPLGRVAGKHPSVGYKKTIVCLANSWKFGSGRCVAGREIPPAGGGAWVRPVSARDGQEVSEEERQFKDGQDPRVLDIIEIEMLRPLPLGQQQENHLIDPHQHWVKRGIATWAQLQASAERPETLWANGYSSSNGINDKVPQPIALTLQNSLYLVRPEGLVVSVGMEPGFDGAPPRRKVRAQFKFGGLDYRFASTDPVLSRHLGDGDTRFPEALLCVSLAAEALNGYCYKLVAAVITPQRSGAIP